MLQLANKDGRIEEAAPSYTNTDLNCCLCVNLVSLLCDKRHYVQNIAIVVFKYLLVHRRAAFEDLLVFPNLIKGSNLMYFTLVLMNYWLEVCQSFLSGSAKFLGVRIRGISRSVGVDKGDIAMIHCCVYMVTRTVTLTAAHQATAMTQDPARHQT
ncbi:hypothetical protein KIW84_062788 [Lathyrus oleraceus]|uniref:Uncharacterized protein n=1 Tax=Pisum sativum TaxID=3888 RepID=A0A9D5A3Z5_PEA|nr:hypothetical protein KIW84_062788 [Pisum sativum]